MKFKMDNSNNSGKIIFDEPLTIENATDIKAILLEAFEKVNHVNINFKSLPDIDLTGLQLICSAHQTFINAKKAFNLDLNNTSAIVSKAKKIGLIRQQGCCQNTSHNCIWEKNFLMGEGT